MLSLGVKLQHYSCVPRSQIDFKTKFFKNDLYYPLWKNWQNANDPNKVPLINHTKTKTYTGKYPKYIKELI